MKVLLLSNLFPTSRDRSRGIFVAQLAQALSRHCEVHALVPLPWFPSGRLAWTLAPGYAEQFADLSARMQFGAVSAHYARYPFFPRLGRRWHAQLMYWGILQRARELHQRIGFDLINAHWLDPDGIVASRIAEELKLPLVLSARGCDVNVYAHDRVRRGGILRAIGRSSAVTAVSAPLKEGLLSEGIAPDLVTVIPNGVDTQLFQPRTARDCRAALSLPLDRELVVCVSRLSPEKGVDVLVRAFAQLRKEHPGAGLAFVGAGPMLAELTELADALEVREAVRFVGAVGHDEVPLWLGAASLVCMPSLREGHPNAAMEALACGRPVVASAVGALPEIVREGSGLLVEPGDPRALSSALSKALAIDWDPGRIAEGVRGASWENAAASYLRVYERALDEKRTRAPDASSALRAGSWQTR
ncbi:MAG TPA: glycosyltransferase [Woeseiaceae bacterium]|nr:glycosyltransferase [Woeseiaceae bacterium]